MPVEELQDFRIPLEIFKNNCKIISKTRAHLKLKILQAIGIDTDAKDQKVSWESFLLLNKLLSPNCTDKDSVCQFAVRLFDPFLGGIVTDDEFENVIRELFATDSERFAM